MAPPELLGEDDWLVPPLEAILTEIFSRFDGDGDGALSVDELQAIRPSRASKTAHPEPTTRYGPTLTPKRQRRHCVQ